MSAIVPKARLSTLFKVALLAGCLLCPWNVSAEHLASYCRTLPTLLSTSLSTARQTRFSLHASLKQHGSLRPTFIPASPTSPSTVAPASESFDLNAPPVPSPAISSDSDFDLPAWERASAPRLKLAPDTSALPHLLSWLDGWRMDIEKGLFRPLGLRASRFAIAYTDIFDTRGHPDKGSHGLGFIFRYDFRKAPDRH